MDAYLQPGPVGSPSRSPNKGKKPTPSKSVIKGVCIFCGEGNENEDIHGKLLFKVGITAHYFCMLFSSGLSQNGASDEVGILGFLTTDVHREVRRGTRLRCSYCKKHGATIGCVTKNCKKSFHLGCGRQNGSFHLFYDNFSSYCAAHRPQQKVPAEKDPNTVCLICMNTVKSAPCNESLRAPCCSKNWYHRDCMQQYSKSAGLYFFKCPMCNNKDEFQQEMLSLGIYIPDQDAAWETEPNAYQELLERHNNCDAEVCKCAEGRKYDKEGSKWEILLCGACGSTGSHIACGYLKKVRKHHFCPCCYEVEMKAQSEKKKWNKKKKKTVNFPVTPESSPPAQKQSESEYPGPLNTILKKSVPDKFNTAVKRRLSLPAKRSKQTSTVTSQSLLGETAQDMGKSPAKRRRSETVSFAELETKRFKMIDFDETPDIKPDINHNFESTSSCGAACSVSECNTKPTKIYKSAPGFRKISTKTLRAQTTLDTWLKGLSFKSDKIKSCHSHKFRSSPRKSEATVASCNVVAYPKKIMWGGEWLQIHQPRVVLKRI